MDPLTFLSITKLVDLKYFEINGKFETLFDFVEREILGTKGRMSRSAVSLKFRRRKFAT